jgi:diadenosine tetraphosphate (Ap4A) HIT family hydrolase
MTDCPFCTRIRRSDLRARLAAVAVLDDAFPVTAGHTLIVPVRHVEGLSELDDVERLGLWSTALEMAERMRREPGVDGVNLGINDGFAAGQTVPHVHLHLIPRRIGDVTDPRGGCRWIIPDRASYWAADRVFLPSA